MGSSGKAIVFGDALSRRFVGISRTLTPAQPVKIVMPRLGAQLFSQFEASEANGGLGDVGDNVLDMQIPL